MTEQARKQNQNYPVNIEPPSKNQLGFIPELIKTCRFTIRGSSSLDYNHTFELKVWDLNEPMGSHHKLAYRFNHVKKSRETGKKYTTCLFYTEAFGCPMSQAVDSNETTLSILQFITMRPGDVENDYFEEYNENQLEFVDMFAEEINFRAMQKFSKPKDLN